MLHLSLLTLPRRSSRWQFLEPYQLHQLLWTAFPGVPRGTGTTYFLYRHDEREYRYDERDAVHSVLVQSIIPPNWESLERDAAGTGVQVREFDPASIAEGTRLRFLVRANPVVRRKGYTDQINHKRPGRHIAVGSDRARQATLLRVDVDAVPTREEQLLEWLKRKGSNGGFDVAYATVGPNHDVIIRRPGQSKPMTFTAVEFEGVLVVRDVEAFAETLRGGIGRGKSFGFGLLSVKRP